MISAHVGTPLDELLQKSDRNSVNFIVPERQQVRFICEHRDKQLAKEHVAPVRGEKESKNHHHGNKARLGIAVLTHNTNTEITVPKHAYQHPWFCPEVDWPTMLIGAKDAASAAARAASTASDRRLAFNKRFCSLDDSAHSAGKSTALESVCSLPIVALDRSGQVQDPQRCIGVLQASNKRNPNGLLSATGFLEPDVNRLRILARTVSIAMQGATAMTERFSREMGLRSVLGNPSRHSVLILSECESHESAQQLTCAYVPCRWLQFGLLPAVIHACMHTHTYVHTYVHVCMHAYIQYMHTYTHMNADGYSRASCLLHYVLDAPRSEEHKAKSQEGIEGFIAGVVSVATLQRQHLAARTIQKSVRKRHAALQDQSHPGAGHKAQTPPSLRTQGPSAQIPRKSMVRTLTGTPMVWPEAETEDAANDESGVNPSLEVRPTGDDTTEKFEEEDAHRVSQSLDTAIRHMACAATEACHASICNIILVLENKSQRWSKASGGGSDETTATRLNHMTGPLSRKFANMPSGGAWGDKDPAHNNDMDLDLRKDSSAGIAHETTSIFKLRLQDTASIEELLARPVGPVPLSLQEHVLRLQSHREGIRLLEDAPESFRVYSFYGKSMMSAECLHSTAPVAGISGAVLRTKKAIRLQHAADHNAFDPHIDSKPGIPTASLLAVPVIDTTDRVRAVITVVNRLADRAAQEGEVSSEGIERHLGFDSFRIADQIALSVLAEGFMGTLIHHEERISFARMAHMVQHISQRPTLRETVNATEEAMAALSNASSATFFFVEDSRGECSTAAPGHSAEEGRMKTRIGHGLVGMCALRRQTITFGEHGKIGRRDDVQYDRGRASEEDVSFEESTYDAWETEMASKGHSAMAVPLLISRLLS